MLIYAQVPNRLEYIYLRKFIESSILCASGRSISKLEASSLKVKRNVLSLPSGETIKSIDFRGPKLLSLKLYINETELEFAATEA